MREGNEASAKQHFGALGDQDAAECGDLFLQVIDTDQPSLSYFESLRLKASHRIPIETRTPRSTATCGFPYKGLDNVSALLLILHLLITLLLSEPNSSFIMP